MEGREGGARRAGRGTNARAAVKDRGETEWERVVKVKDQGQNSKGC